MQKALAILGINFLFLCSLIGQTKNNSENQVVKGQFWGVDEGLSHRQVNSIVQDNSDLIWLATDYGINRFDGKSFKWFTTENSGLSDNQVALLKKDQQGFIWIFYSDLNKTSLMNIDVLDPKKENIVSLQDFLPKGGIPFDFSEIITMSLNESDEITFVSKTSLFYYSNRFHEIPLNGSNVLDLRGVERSPAGDFWLSYYMLYSETSYFKVLSSSGEHLDSIAFERSRYIDIYEWDSLSRPHFYIYYHEIETDEPYQKYFYIEKNGTVKPDFRAEKIFGKLALKNNFLRRFFTKAHGNYWVYSKDERMLMVPPDPQQKAVDLKIVSKQLRNGGSVFADRQGAVWITSAYGLHRLTLDDLRFKRCFYEQDGVDPRSIRGIKVTGKGKNKKLWAMAEQPRFLYSKLLNGGEEKVEESFSGGKWALGFSSDTMLLYMSDLGLKIVDPSGASPDSLIPLPVNVSGGAWVIHQDKYGQLWFNSHFRASFFRLARGKLIEYSLWHGADVNPYVYQIYENESDTAWAVTAAGIFTFNLKNGSMLERFHSGGKGQYYLQFDNIQHLLPNDDGSFWLATAKHGLVQWSPTKGSIRHYGRLEGLPSNNVYAVYKDQKNNLWLSTEYGIAQLDPSTKKIRSYTQNDGLSNNEFNRISHYQDEDGIIYFGGLNGLTYFQPLDFYLEEDTYEPNLILTKLDLFRAKENSIQDLKVLAQDEALIMKPGDYITEITVALLSYQELDKVQYAYILEGLNENWTYQASNVIQLGKIPFGDYTLKIRGQESSGRWSGRELSIPILVLKPFYLRVWFIFITLFFLVGSVSLFIYLRQRAQKARRIELEKLVVERTQIIENQKEELRSLDRMKSQFFANISHELRTPLSLISSPLNKLMSQKDSFSEKEQRWLSYMQRNAGVLLNLVNEILDLSKLEAGRLKLREEELVLFSYFESILAPFKVLAKDKNLEFRWQINLDPNVKVALDKSKTNKVLNNLLTNAFKFTNEGGSVAVNIRPDDENTLWLSIKDTGIGIKESDLSKIFDRFYQVSQGDESEIAEAQGGTGLGLSLSLDLVHFMGGELWAESEYGKGSVFYLKLPYRELTNSSQHRNKDLQEKSLERIEKSINSPQDYSKPHILIVEDNVELRSFIKDLLSESFRISEATNGAEAWEMLEKTLNNQEEPSANCDAFDLVLSDQMMPVMDGLSLLKKMKESEIFSLTPFIMLTARAEGRLKMTALRIGVNDFLTKPFLDEELLLRINNLLENSKSRKEFISTELALERDSDSLTKLEQQWLEQFDSFIQSNLVKGDLKVAEIAYEFSMSESTLLRQVKKTSGLSPQKYLKEARLQRALIYLEEGEYSQISQVANAVGYNDLASFSRSFKARFGKAPSSFI